MSLVVQNITSTASKLYGVKGFKKINAANTGSGAATLSLYYTGVARRNTSHDYSEAVTVVERDYTFYIVKDLSIDAAKSTIILEEGLDFRDMKYYDSDGVLYNLFDVQLNASTGTEGQTVDLIIELSYDYD
tara:strand:- start:2397 stop:2789 length:393 start_codon:yes stop_codon:yes gene_type:complete